jgi:Ca2+-binding EF-hand superfamily protein
MQTLFKEFDSEGSGEITCSQFLGSMAETSDGHDDWQYLTTMEKWTKWCSNTDHPTSKTEEKHTWSDPLHKATEDISAIRCQLEGERDRSRARMQRMIQQGMHKTKAGLHLAAAHLPKDISNDNFCVQRYRQHSLEKVEQQSRRIKQQIEHTSLARHELKHCCQALRSVEEKAKREVAQEWLQEHRCDLKIPGRPERRSTIQFNLVNDFSEDQLDEEEQDLRHMARLLGMPLPDAEAIQVQYRRHSKAGEGVVQATFSQLVRSLMGDVFSDAKMHELWRSIDTKNENKGHITFEEYLEWHSHTLDHPHLSLQVQSSAKGSHAKGSHVGFSDTANRLLQ